MKVVVTIAALNLEHGGPPRTVPALCRALAQRGADVELITISEGRAIDPSESSEPFETTMIATKTNRYRPSSWCTAFRERLREALANQRDCVLYDVGLWLPANHYVAQIARATRTPLVVSPRGMLSLHALQIGKWKKKIAWQLYQKRDLRSARTLHATSAAEAEDLRDLKLGNPVAVIPNGADIPREIPGRSDKADRIRMLLFLSRIHPLKGLLDLVRAWAQVRPPDWRAVIAGPDENNHRREVEKLVNELGLQSQFEFMGAVGEGRKWKLLARADLFALPSYSESFGLAIAEALASGLPVITTEAAPWEDIAIHHCGWRIPTGVESLTAALRDATARSDEELRAMGARGREMVMQKYSWDAAAEKMLNLFRSILEGGDCPGLQS